MESLFQDHLKHLAKSGLFQRGVELGLGIYIFTWKNEGTVFRKSGLKYVAGQRFIYMKI